MLTLADIQNITFRKASIGGYRPEDVDNFIDGVIASYEALLQEREAQKKELQAAVDKAEEYRGREGNIGAALMNAQRQADLVIREAEHRAEILIHDAEYKAEQLLTQAQAKIEGEETSLQSLKKEISLFKSKLMALYKEHLLLIEALPEEDELQETAVQPPAVDVEPVEEISQDIPQPEEKKEEEPLPEAPVAPPATVPVEPANTPEEPKPAPASAFFEPSDFVPPVSPQEMKTAEKAEEPQAAVPSAEKKEDGFNSFVVDLSAFEKVEDERFYEEQPAAPQKFNALKFGDDYNINSDDDMKTPLVRFKRKK